MLYRQLLEFVSWNFQCSQRDDRAVLECRVHGTIAVLEGRPRDGELEMMRAIGQHMDQEHHEEIPDGPWQVSL